MGRIVFVVGRLFVPSRGPNNEVIEAVAVDVADHWIASLVLKQRHPHPFFGIPQFVPAGIEIDVTAVCDVVDVAIVVEVTDARVLALAMLL